MAFHCLRKSRAQGPNSFVTGDMSPDVTTALSPLRNQRELRAPPARLVGEAVEANQVGDPRSYKLALTIALVAIFCPPVQVEFAGVILTPGRVVTILFILPAVFAVRRRRGGLYAADVCALLTSAWCIVATMLNGGFRPYVAVEALELFSGYMIGRAFTFGILPLQTFVRILKWVSLGLILLAALDTISGRRFTAETVAHFFSLPFDAGDTQYRNGLVRATSTFPTSELFGLFCVACASIFLYSEQGLRRKLTYSGLAVVGTILSVSSGPALALGIVLGSFCYGIVFSRSSRKWKILRNAIIGSLLFAFLFDVVILGNDATHPILWVVRNFTFDPWTGYWRVETWQHAMPVILSAPLVGIGFNSVDPRDLYLRSLDSVYLVMMWRFGIPATLFLLATIISTVAENQTRAPTTRDEAFLCEIRTGLSLAIVAIAVVGLTVHLWDSTWIFWSMSMGVRVSLKEYHRMRVGKRLNSVAGAGQSRTLMSTSKKYTSGLDIPISPRSHHRPMM